MHNILYVYALWNGKSMILLFVPFHIVFHYITVLIFCDSCFHRITTNSPTVSLRSALVVLFRIRSTINFFTTECTNREKDGQMHLLADNVSKRAITLYELRVTQVSSQQWSLWTFALTLASPDVILISFSKLKPVVLNWTHTFFLSPSPLLPVRMDVHVHSSFLKIQNVVLPVLMLEVIHNIIAIIAVVFWWFCIIPPTTACL